MKEYRIVWKNPTTGEKGVGIWESYKWYCKARISWHKECGSCNEYEIESRPVEVTPCKP